MPACVKVTVAVPEDTDTAQVTALPPTFPAFSELPSVKSQSTLLTTRYSVVSATFVTVNTSVVNV